MEKEIQVKIYNHLPAEAAAIRRAVFMEEQGFVNEFDDIDKMARHIVLYESGIPVATCRLYYSDDKKCHVIGRIAVSRSYRGNNYGVETVRYAEREIRKRGVAGIGLSAQLSAVGFYERLGYHSIGETYQDEGCTHIWMEKGRGEL